MRRITRIAALSLAAALATGAELGAQEAPGSSAWEGELRAMVSEPIPADRNREEISDFLERDDVRAAADERGIDLDGLRTGVATLNADEAADLAKRVRDAEAALPQDRVVISTTAIIIALLVIILVLVA